MLNSPQINAPDATLVATAGSAGDLDGTYFYAVTFVSPDGETNYGPLTGPLMVSAQCVDLSEIPISSDPSVTTRRIYRTSGTPPNNDYVYFLATIADNTTTVFADNIPDGSLGANIAPSLNQTGAITISASQAMAFGTGALGSFAVGTDALANNTGAANMAVGEGALFGNTAGRFNVAIGYHSLFSNTLGENNLALGAQALYTNTTGVVNVAIGSNALYSNISGDHNTTVGVDSLFYNTTGQFNACLSYDALHLNTTGGGGTAIGYQALYSGTTGNTNTALGFQAGYHNTTGSNNIYIGSNADTSDGTISNAIAIGCDATLSASDQIIIGNSSHATAQVRGCLDAPDGLKGKGTTAADNAAAGYIGEYISSEIAPASAVSLSNGTGKNITAISLTAGDWDVWGNIVFRPASTTLVISLTAFISTASETYPGTANQGAVGRMAFPAAFVPNDDIALLAGMKRLSLATTTTVYLESVQYFSVSTMTGFGFIGARRVR
jgi:hypothetical protein